MKFCIPALLFPFMLLTAQTQTTSWNGQLDVNGVKLGLVFHIDQEEEARASLSVPAQGVKELPADVTTITADSIFLSFSDLQMKYRGKFLNAQHISGTFIQRGIELPLELFQGTVYKGPERPQTPVPPFPYIDREITFFNEGAALTLSGTFSIPEGEGPFPAAVLVSGSGPQDRDSNIAEHQWFVVLADHLLRNGIAVLRYDERGTGDSEGSFATATTRDFTADAKAAFTWLEQQPEVQTDRVGIVGHSEGGIVATMAANTMAEIDYIVLLGAPMVKGKHLLLKQKLDIEVASGYPQEGAEAANAVFAKVYDDIIAADLEGEALNSLIKERFNHYTNNTIPEEQLSAIATNLSSPWMKYFLATDPGEHLSDIRVPVLAIYGAKDFQVDPVVNSERLRAQLNETQLNATKVYILPGKNHLLQPAQTGLPNEYSAQEITIDPEVLEIMSKWINLQ